MSSILANDDIQAVASKRIAILIPCHNEELTVAEVAADFRAEVDVARGFLDRLEPDTLILDELHGDLRNAPDDHMCSSWERLKIGWNGVAV